MAWQMDATMIECCSCKAMCPCWLGPEEIPDQGWCAGALVIDIDKGAVDGVDVSGCKAALCALWPGNFFGGHGTVRVYVDSRASDAQRSALEDVMSGRKGGMFAAVLGPATDKWLPASSVPIDIEGGDAWTASIGDVGRVKLAPYKDMSGRPATVRNTMAQEAFQSESMALASAKGTTWRDADLRAWEGDSGTTHKVRWAG